MGSSPGRQMGMAVVLGALLVAALAWWWGTPAVAPQPEVDGRPAGPTVQVQAAGSESVTVGGEGAAVVRDELASVPVAPPIAAVASVCGRFVADEDGRPLAGCVVRCIGEAEHEVTSGSDGRFVIQVPSARPFELSVVADGRASRRGEWSEPLRPGDREDLGDVRLRRAFRVAGRVVDTHGAGVAGAGVVVFGIDVALRAGTLDPQIAGARTDASGAFVLDHLLPPGAWRALAMGHTQRDRGDFVVDLHLGVDELLLVVEPDQLSVLAGVVVDDLGEPVANVRLETRQPSALATTDEHGRFELRARGAHDGDCELIVRNPGRCDADPRPRLVRWGVQDLRIELNRAHELTVEVVDDAGHPVEDFGVWIGRDSGLLDDEQLIRWRGVHAGGRVVVAPVRSGSNVLRVCPTAAEWMASEPQRIEIGTGPQPAVRVVVPRLRPGTVEVVDQQGAAVPRALVELVRMRGGVDHPLQQALDLRARSGWRVASTTPEAIATAGTGADGTATLLIPSDLRTALLRIDHAPFEPFHQQAPALVPGGTLRVVLATAGAIRGEVALHGQSAGWFTVRGTDPTGEPIRFMGKPEIALATDGSFAVSRLGAGVHRLVLCRRVHWQDRSTAARGFVPLVSTARDVMVTPGETAVLELDAGVEAFGALHGRVRCDSLDLTGWRADLVFVQGSSARQGAFAIAADGSFRADRVLPGRHRVQLRPPDLWPTLATQLRDEVEIRAGLVTPQEFTFAPRRLVLQLRHADGRPMTGAWDLRCGTQQVEERQGAECVLDPAPEVPVQVRRNGAHGPWSQSVSMPIDRSELVVEVVVPGADR